MQVENLPYAQYIFNINTMSKKYPTFRQSVTHYGELHVEPLHKYLWMLPATVIAPMGLIVPWFDELNEYYQSGLI